MGKYTSPKDLNTEKNNAPKPGSWRRLVVGGVVVLLVVGVGSAASYMWRQKSQKQASAKCSGAMIGEAHTAMSPFLKEQQQQQKLKPLVDKIQKTPNYEQDVNCLYVVTSYYMIVGDVLNSKNYLDKTNKIYDPKVGLSKELGFDRTMDDLRSRFKLLEQRTEQEFKNDRAFYPL